MKLIRIFTLMAVLVISSCGLFKSAEDLFSNAEQKRNMGEAKGHLNYFKSSLINIRNMRLHRMPNI